MYGQYFAFSEPPFSIAPDPRYLYMSSRHREAVAHLLYGVESDGGFVLLTGDIGTGKTTVCRWLLESLPERCDVAFIYNPKLTVRELLATICEEFGISTQDCDGRSKQLVDKINAYLLDAYSRGRKALLIIDEAQNLSTEVLEQLRLLTNLETNERKLLQIFLLGQPELQQMLAKESLHQLAQRIVARYHLYPLSETEVAAYVNHRLTVAGSGRHLFPPGVLRRIYKLSKGVPRVINLLCDRALLGVFVEGKEHVDHKTLKKAAREVLGDRGIRARLVRFARWGIGAAVLGGCAMLAIAYHQQGPRSPQVIQKDAPRTLPLAVSPRSAPITEYDPMIWPDRSSTVESESMAMAVLFNLWGLEYRVNGGEPFCQQAVSKNLRCLSERGGLSDLRRLNLPAVLQLTDIHGEKFHAALTSLTEESAVLIMGEGVVKEVPLHMLTENWKGAYTVLWRAPPNYNGPIQPGSKGEEVIWLRKQLAAATGYNAEADDKSRFDAGLTRQLTKFKASERLSSQSVVGPTTLIRLTTRTDANAPRLMN